MCVCVCRLKGGKAAFRFWTMQFFPQTLVPTFTFPQHMQHEREDDGCLGNWAKIVRDGEKQEQMHTNTNMGLFIRTQTSSEP